MSKWLKTNQTNDRRAGLALLVAATGLCAGLMPLGAIGALFSPLIFDGRGNMLNPLAWLGFLLMVGFWIVCIVAPYVAWIYWRRQKETLAWALMSAPLIWAMATIVVLQFVPG
ncbi:hypothetical protein MCEMIH16_01295 [Caulobacteraceae bacterium]|jgi:hypothetical protein